MIAYMNFVWAFPALVLVACAAVALVAVLERDQ